MRLPVVFAWLAGICACSTFTQGTEDAGAVDPPVDSGPSPAPTEGGTPDGGLPEEGGSNRECAVFGTSGTGVPVGWVTDLQGGALSMSSVDNMPCMNGRVVAAAQHAAATRDLTFPPDGKLSISVNLHLTADLTTATGWLVDVVTVACTSPQMQVALEVSQGALLTVEAAPAAGAGALALGPANVEGLAPISFGFAGTNVSVMYRGFTGSVSLAASVVSAKGCTLTVGAVAVNNVPPVSADIARACVQGL